MRINNYYFLVLDLETSTLENENNEPLATWLSYAYINLYDRQGERIETNYFREWDELANILNRIQQRFVKTKILCFVHNLAYEFDFIIKNLSRPETFLSNSSHDVISTILEDFPQVEFRCTLRLTMKSLAELGQAIGLKKLDSDYRTILPNEEPTEEEKIYCIRDCDIVARYVGQFLLKEWDTFVNMPLTKTGRVRKYYNKKYAEYVEIHGKPKWDLPPPEDCYQAELDAFGGGCTFSNPMFTGIVLNGITSYDISSSYPFAQLSEEFPYTIEREKQPLKWMLKEKFWIAKLKFTNIKTKFNWGWLTVSKMNEFDGIHSDFFNGKLIYSNWCIRTITNVDYEMICKTYDFDDVEIIEFYHMYNWGTLPQPYIDTIKHFGKQKYEMKIVDSNTPKNDPNYFDIHIKYMNAKADFNSIYGMSVQKICHQEYTIDEFFVWKKKEIKYKQTKKHMRRNFLFGVYVTAYARRNLLNAILKNCPETFVYCDTDSIKFIGKTVFVNTNKELPDEYKSIPWLSNIGQFDCDGEYEKFICYGAKKYAYTLPNDSNIYLTVAGLPKFKDSQTQEIYYNNKRLDGLKSIYDFRCGTLFNNCKLGKKYITINKTFDLDEEMIKENVKEIDDYTLNFLTSNNIKTNGGVALYKTSYYLDMIENDKIYILDQRRVLKLWLKEYKNKNGIDLTEFVDMTHPINL